ncbi:MAG: acetylornithine transaminase [Chloroflexi bacterium]|nr:acetylornithine transaminase [Chloroflexota bacterium]
MTNWQELEKKYYFQVVKRLPVTLVRGQGARVWDDTGKEYLDFTAGWAVNSLGHCHPVVAQALADQANTLIHTSNQFYTVPQIRLAQLLVENSCFDKVFLCNSGTEANEGAVKLARKYGKLHRKGAFEVITTFNSFHGRTLAMVAATGQRKFQQPYIPLPSGFVNVEYSSIEAIEKATTSQTCAVMVEPIQGEGGVIVPAEDYLKKVRAWCDQKGLLLILDEIQTGIGRTGTLFAYQQSGIEPDIMTLAKGLGGGVPIGAVLATNKSAVFELGEHGSTYGGNPLASAAALATLKFILENDVSAKVRQVGQYLASKLEEMKSKFDFIVEVRGRGLLWAMEFNREIADSLVSACQERGLLVNGVKPNALRFMPPLIISEAEVDQAKEILQEALASFS